jgi:hypothetical protein
LFRSINSASETLALFAFLTPTSLPMLPPLKAMKLSVAQHWQKLIVDFGFMPSYLDESARLKIGHSKSVFWCNITANRC